MDGESHERWSAQVNDTPDLLQLVSSLVCTLIDDTIATINPAGVQMLAAPSAEALLNRQFSELIAEDYRFLLEVGWVLLAAEDVIPLKMKRLNGDIFDAELRIRPLDEAHQRVFLEVRDISKFVRSAQALREREERLQNILHSVTEGIITVTENGIIESANSAADRMFKAPNRGLLGKNLDSLIGNCRVVSAAADPLTPPPPPFQNPGILNEGLGICLDGSTFSLEIVCNKLRHDRQHLLTAVLRDISERKENEERIRRLAHHDSLTGLPNRNLLHDRMAQALARVRRNNGRLAILFVDLDKFKPINDKYGHKVGDAVLVEVAKRLLISVRNSDTVARIGGDEFAVILEEIHTPSEASKIAAKIVSLLSPPIEALDQLCQIGASVGVALYPDDGLDLDEVVKAADQAMYRVKKAGRNGYRMFNETTAD